MSKELKLEQVVDCVDGMLVEATGEKRAALEDIQHMLYDLLESSRAEGRKGVGNFWAVLTTDSGGEALAMFGDKPILTNSKDAARHLGDSLFGDYRIALVRIQEVEP